MLKKIISTIVAALFSAGLTVSFAKTPVKTGVKKWDPTDKPAAEGYYDDKGNKVDVKNLTKIKGKTLYDKQGNAYQIQDGKIIKLNKQKMLQKRIGPGPVA
jgi:hypothetical protein